VAPTLIDEAPPVEVAAAAEAEALDAAREAEEARK
jgi:hypothetical protein